MSQRWVPSDEQESALMDKIMEVCRRLQQLECLLVERFDHSKKPASKSADLEGISLDEDQVILVFTQHFTRTEIFCKGVNLLSCYPVSKKFHIFILLLPVGFEHGPYAVAK